MSVDVATSGQNGSTPRFDLTGKKIWVAGHRGMVGSAIVRRMQSMGCELLLAGRRDVDLTRQSEVEGWVETHRPDAVVVAAAKVGGILANDSLPVDFLYNNLLIQANIAKACHDSAVRKVLFLGSSCIYPRMAPQPITEEALLTGPLEPTNQWYAVAKIAGIKLSQAYRRQYRCDFIAAMPTNLYGPGDNYDLSSSHVVPALIRKAHEAKQRGDASIVVWGTGSPRREFLHVDDCADALILLLETYSAEDHINVGSGTDITILELAQTVCDVVGFRGTIERDLTKPDGTPRKLMSGSRLQAMGWKPKIPLRDGLFDAYTSFLAANTRQ